VRSSFIFFFGQQSLDAAEDLGSEALRGCQLFLFRQQLIAVIGFDCLLVNLNRRTQAVSTSFISWI